VWQPRNAWDFPEARPSAAAPKSSATAKTYAVSQIASAWVPWLILSSCVFVWGLPQVRTMLDGISSRSWPVAYLDQHVRRDRPVVEQPEEREPAVYRFNWLSATGTGIFVAALVSAGWMRIAPAVFVRIFFRTVYQMRWPLATIAMMLAIAYTTRYSGLDATLGLAFTRSGKLYPFFAALLGWLGVALTGSDTSSNALFGSLQKITAEGLVRKGILPLTTHQASVLLAAANSTGGVMGKMIDAQSIVVSAAATQQPGAEGQILRFVFWHSVVLAILMGLLVLAQAYLWTWMIP
jgi:lactate permease